MLALGDTVLLVQVYSWRLPAQELASESSSRRLTSPASVQEIGMTSPILDLILIGQSLNQTIAW
jgi:hypothetical protein|nr:hypothetical protein Q903MT_gene5411 [Picea sitchensis]